MIQRPILLIEYVDAAGAAARDVRVRAAALNRIGCTARTVIVERHDAWGLHPSPSGAAGIDRLHDDDEGRSRLSAILDECDPETILVASASEGGGVVGRWLHDEDDARWWPTAIGGAPSRAATASGGMRSGPLPSLDVAATPIPGLHWSTLEYSRLKRSQLPLWDGDYVLSPAPLAGQSGETALRSFAELCESNAELDFIVLADPQPTFVNLAKQLGIGLRVHFAGVAPRDAEISWLTSAVAALIVGDGPLAGGLLLRALACGCPLVPVSGGALADHVGPWLESNGLGVGYIDSQSGIDVLRSVVSRSVRLSAMIDQGRRLAEAATVEATAARLAAALDPDVGVRRAA